MIWIIRSKCRWIESGMFGYLPTSWDIVTSGGSNDASWHWSGEIGDVEGVGVERDASGLWWKEVELGR